MIMAFITINIGVANLLPLPALDGGRFFFLLIEAIRRKPINPKYEGYVHAIGFILLMLLMVVVTYNDIVRLIKNLIFESFSVILRQISLGVHSYAVVYFPCLTKKSFKNRDFGSFRRYCDKYHSEYIRMLSFIFLVLRKRSFKIEDFGVFAVTLG